MTKVRLTREADTKRRLLQKLQASNKLIFDIGEEVEGLVSSGHYTQAFLTQWMAVEQVAIHIIKASMVCNWCEDTFNSISYNLGDVGYRPETIEKKIYEPLFSKYPQQEIILKKLMLIKFTSA